MQGRPRNFNYDVAIEAAMNVFWCNGYENSSTEQLCEKTGLGRGSLYNTFCNKHLLYEKALILYQERAIKKQTEILEGVGTIKTRLRALLDWSINGCITGTDTRSCMAMFASLERGNKDPKIKNINKSYIIQLEKVLLKTFTQGQELREFSSQYSAQQMARTFLGNYYGLRIIVQSISDRDFIDDITEGILSRL